jgi:hypothetical protein
VLILYQEYPYHGAVAGTAGGGIFSDFHEILIPIRSHLNSLLKERIGYYLGLRVYSIIMIQEAIGDKEFIQGIFFSLAGCPEKL